MKATFPRGGGGAFAPSLPKLAIALAISAGSIVRAEIIISLDQTGANLGLNINSSSMEGCPAISDDGLELYF